MKYLVAFLAFAFALPFAQSEEVDERIVKIHVVQQPYLATKPWSRSSTKDVSGTGFIYKPGHIITNAHVVKFARQVYIQPYQSSLKIEAEVAFTAPGIDLAILRPVEDELSDFAALEIDPEIPKVASTVKIHGYPLGGDELAITEGVISRIEVASYNEATYGLRIQVDAAINSGNSGGPAFVDGKLVGIVFSRIREADNIGYVIPTDEVVQFLDDVDDGTYDGKWLFPYHTTRLQNQALRARYGLSSDMGGLLITDTLDDRIGAKGLQSEDALLKIGEHDIDRTGNVRIRPDLRLGFRYMIPKLAVDGRLPLTLIRDGKTIETKIELTRDQNRIVPYIGEAQPEYFIYGPLSFTVASQEFVMGMPKNLRQTLAERGFEPLYRRLEQRSDAAQELVICPTKMFAHPMTKGISDPLYSTLKRLNGETIVDLEHVVSILDKLGPKDTATFEFSTVDHTRTNRVVLEHGAVLESIEDILSDNGIRRPYSANLRSLWSGY